MTNFAIPQTITGDPNLPAGQYGASANHRQYNYLQGIEGAKDTFYRSNPAQRNPQDFAAIHQANHALNNATIRYTPEGTIAEGQVSQTAIKNVMGFAKADIRHYDQNGDGQLDAHEVQNIYLQPIIKRMQVLANTMSNPQVSPQARQYAQQKMAAIQPMIDGATQKAANFMQAVDVNGDGKISADELGANEFFDDNSAHLFHQNAFAYKTLIGALQSKTDYDGPSFQHLEKQVKDIQSSTSNPFALDGQITPQERQVSDALLQAPIPTGQIIKSIHDTLNLGNAGPRNNRQSKL